MIERFMEKVAMEKLALRQSDKAALEKLKEAKRLAQKRGSKTLSDVDVYKNVVDPRKAKLMPGEYRRTGSGYEFKPAFRLIREYLGK